MQCDKNTLHGEELNRGWGGGVIYSEVSNLVALGDGCDDKADGVHPRHDHGRQRQCMACEFESFVSEFKTRLDVCLADS